jgi:hypothetical protein
MASMLSKLWLLKPSVCRSSSKKKKRSDQARIMHLDQISKKENIRTSG